MSEAQPAAREPVSILRTLGFALVALGVAGCFSPLVIGPWSAAGLSPTDASLALAVIGWLLVIAAAVRRRRARRRSYSASSASDRVPK